MLEKVKKLCNVDGVSGFEKNASELALEMLTPLVDKAYIDKFGSVIGYKYSKNPNAKTVMLDAHIDQIGFMVTAITDEGFLRFTSVGGVDPRMLLATDVLVLGTEPLRGVICSTPPHVTADFSKSVPVSEMTIDIGFQSKERAMEFVKIGTPIIYADEAYQISSDSITSKALDDRAAIGSILHTLEKLKDVDTPLNIVAVFSGTEEVGGPGSQLATFAIKPDFAIAIDVTHAKTPDAPREGTFDMGKVIVCKGPNMHKKITEDIIRVAKAYDIAYDIEVEEGATGTNARHIQIVRDGVPVALLGIPLKYMHTQIETVKLSDITNVGELMYRYIQNYREENHA